MSRIKTVKSVASTLTIAIAVGFLMQYGDADGGAGNAGTDEQLGQMRGTMMLATNPQGEPVFGVPNVVTQPANHAANVRQIVAVDAVYTEFSVPDMGTIMAIPLPGCGTSLTAQRKPAAMVDLVISSPCYQNANFVVEHEGLRFTEWTDSEGKAVIEAPALVAQAKFNVAFDNVQAQSVEVFVPEIRRFDRAVLQWQSKNNVQLHAFVDDAGIGQTGHVWSASSHTPEDARNGTYGFVRYLGSTDGELPYQAEVYTFPADLMNREGNVSLRIGVSVSGQNCEREVDAATIQTNAGEKLLYDSIAIQMPSCDRIGQVDFVDDQFADLTLAAGE